MFFVLTRKRFPYTLTPLFLVMSLRMRWTTSSIYERKKFLIDFLLNDRTVKLSMRLPPNVESKTAAESMKKALEANTPYGAKVSPSLFTTSLLVIPPSGHLLHWEVLQWMGESVALPMAEHCHHKCIKHALRQRYFPPSSQSSRVSLSLNISPPAEHLDRISRYWRRGQYSLHGYAPSEVSWCPICYYWCSWAEQARAFLFHRFLLR